MEVPRIFARLLLTAPGWIRTGLGGDDGPYTVEESIPLIVDVPLSHLDNKGLAYLDRFGEPVPWCPEKPLCAAPL
ncbi:hypothetical protein [Streptomyces boncukensis]|uniref:hypothetical protein n=1 Tax=Streptomyces boncukensis TaxID=2711219 RepID=UPI003B96C123